MNEATGQRGSKFVYVVYIRTTPEELWRALTDPTFQRQYWVGMVQESSWEAGAEWKLLNGEELMDSGEIVSAEEPKQLVIKWRNEFRPELRAEGASRATYILEPSGPMVKLTVMHESDVPESKVIAAVSGGWPMILSNLKSLLETGTAPIQPGGSA